MKLPKDSIILFYCIFFILVILSLYVDEKLPQYIFPIAFLVLVLFAFYTVVRLDHYKKYFSQKSSFFYVLMEVALMLLGTTYIFLSQYFLAMGESVVEPPQNPCLIVDLLHLFIFNLLYGITVIIFYIPAFIGNERLTQKDNNYLAQIYLNKGISGFYFQKMCRKSYLLYADENRCIAIKIRLKSYDIHVLRAELDFWTYPEKQKLTDEEKLKLKKYFAYFQKNSSRKIIFYEDIRLFSKKESEI